MIISKENKSAVSKYKSLERKKKKLEESLASVEVNSKELLKSIPYPIFVRESDSILVAHLSIDSKITIKKTITQEYGIQIIL